MLAATCCSCDKRQDAVYEVHSILLYFSGKNCIILSLTVEEEKNRCNPLKYKAYSDSS